jgi:hypothetical protein
MNLVARLRPAVPVAVALAGVLVALAVSSRLLPRRVVLVHLSDTGGAAFAASRGDLGLLGLLLVVGIVLVWLVAAFFLAVTPARHLLVPHAAFWKQPAHRPEMRRRYARYLAVATSASLWFVAALFVLAIVSQEGPLAVWWLPAVISTAYVLFVLVGLVWVFTAGFTPSSSAVTAARAPARTSGETDAAPGARVTPGAQVTPGARSTPGARVTPGARPVPGAARSAAAPPVAGTTPRRGPGGSTLPSADGPRQGPPRPYQPRPRSGGPRG